MYLSWDSAYHFEASDDSATYKKSKWIKILPEVLTFRILRVDFDKEKQSLVKNNS